MQNRPIFKATMAAVWLRRWVWEYPAALVCSAVTANHLTGASASHAAESSRPAVWASYPAA